jgi:periplasmic divalent cation tolerance protein
MKTSRQARIVLVTCGSLKEGQLIARKVVEKRLAACVNVGLSPVESIYTWKGRVERSREFLLIIKTTARRLRELEREVKSLHSYEVPEFVVLPIITGSKEYLAWMSACVAPAENT